MTRLARSLIKPGRRSRPIRGPKDSGSAPVGFLFTSVLMIGVLVGLIELIVLMHQRVILIDIAGESARNAALYETHVSDYARLVSEIAGTRAEIVRVTASDRHIEGSEVLVLEVHAAVKLVGLVVPLEVQGSALREQLP